MIDRLFVPLNAMWHRLFLSGEKTWELRGVNSRFNEDTVRIGRAVEIRRGYCYDSYVGTIDAYVIAEKWEDLPAQVRVGVIPNSVANDDAAKNFLKRFLQKYDSLIAFKIVGLTPRM